MIGELKRYFSHVLPDTPSPRSTDDSARAPVAKNPNAPDVPRPGIGLDRSEDGDRLAHVRSAPAAKRMVADIGVAGWMAAVNVLPVPAITLTNVPPSSELSRPTSLAWRSW